MSRILHAGVIAVAISGCLAASEGEPRDEAVEPPPQNSEPPGSLPPGEEPPPFEQPPPTGSACEEVGPPVTPRLRRLTFAQYDRTVSDLVGFEVTPSADLGPEIDGVTPVLWAGVQVAATRIATRVSSEGRIESLLPCQPEGDGSECARRFAEDFGARAFRRPLTAEELAGFTDLYRDRAELTAGGTFEEGIELMLEVFLQSPDLLLRVETSSAASDGRIALSGYEVATRLSYALWNGPPDSELLAAAGRGDLDTAEGVRGEAIRMLSTEDGIARARPLIRSAHRDWLGMEGEYAQFWSNTLRDPTLFPEFYEGIDADFREEILRFVDHVVFAQDGSFRDLFTSPVTIVNGPLSRIYGYDGSSGEEWVERTLDPARRPGLLTRAGFVGTHGRFGRGSLIYRGAFVLKRMLCLEIGSPPAGADATQLPESSETLRTTRQRVEAMTSAPACAGCHQHLINPAGFAFELFDGIGRFREEENGAQIDPTGKIWLTGGEEPYAGPAEYGEILGASEDARSCYVSRFAEFTFGQREVELGCTEVALARRLGEDGASIKDFLAEFVASDAFRFRSVEEAE